MITAVDKTSAANERIAALAAASASVGFTSVNHLGAVSSGELRTGPAETFSATTGSPPAVRSSLRGAPCSAKPRGGPPFGLGTHPRGMYLHGIVSSCTSSPDDEYQPRS